MKMLWIAGAMLGGAVTVLAEPNWSLLDFGGGHPIRSSAPGIFHEFYVSPRTPVDAKFGPLSLWVPKGQDPIMISQSISGLDDLLRAEFAASPSSAINNVVSYIRMYRGHEQAFELVAQRRDDFLKWLQAKLSRSSYDEIVRLIVEPVWRVNGDLWESSFTVVTKRGAIEWRSYTGRRTPLSITREVVELVAPSGTIPNVDFVPSLDNIRF